MGGAKRVTNVQIAEMFTKMEAALQTPLSAPGFSQEDHDALISLGTDMKYVKEAAKRWDDNHTVVANLKQRVTLLSGGVALLGGGALVEIIRRAIDHFTT